MDNLSGASGGGVALVRLLLTKPDVLILDEPTNHLDAETVEWLEQHLKRYAGTVIAVTHDRYFLDNVAGWILELDRGPRHPDQGQLHGLPGGGRRRGWRSRRSRRRPGRRRWAGSWNGSARGPRPRVAKSKARLAKYEEMVSQDQRETEKQVEIFIPPGPRLGERVITAEKLTKAFGDKLLLNAVDFVLPPNAIVGIIGPNGAGRRRSFAW